MGDPEINADPDRLRAIAEELSMFANDVKAELIVLKTELAKLGGSWQDDEYRKFKNSIQPLLVILERFSEEIVRSKPAMIADAEALRVYKKLQTP